MIKSWKEFGDCALIEIIHLHDCLRGALDAMERDVLELRRFVQKGQNNDDGLLGCGKDRKSLLRDLEHRVAGRFKVIWSVFRAHSKAEDEFIWPCLRAKTQGRAIVASEENGSISNDKYEDVSSCSEGVLEREYEEDHADEERMFSEMDTLLNQIREVIMHAPLPSSEFPEQQKTRLEYLVTSLAEKTRSLSLHLTNHLEKEETHCMPLVQKHLSKSEIHDLVGQIMGKRSADTIAQIMTIAVQSLEKEERDEMVKYMKQSMAGTYFESWLRMSGWMSSSDSYTVGSVPTIENSDTHREKKRSFNVTWCSGKRLKSGTYATQTSSCVTTPITPAKNTQTSNEATSQEELENLVCVIMSNPALTALQKTTTIQGLRDSVWKSNQRLQQRTTSRYI